jgi:ATP-dependent DNA helicase RecG
MSPKETQTIEWKESWHDEYLRWICGFANARGGTLIIGKNDRGTVLGVANAKRLLEDIPNKIKDILGIIVDVNLRVEQGKDLIEIVVEAYPYPVNYKGEYYYRSGSTRQVFTQEAGQTLGWRAGAAGYRVRFQRGIFPDLSRQGCQKRTRQR